MPPLLRSRLPVTSQFTIITRYAIVAGIRLHASATTRLNGDLLLSVVLFRSLGRSWNTRAGGSPSEKLHVTKRQNAPSSLQKEEEESGNFLILRFPSASRRTASRSGRKALQRKKGNAGVRSRKFPEMFLKSAESNV